MGFQKYRHLPRIVFHCDWLPMNIKIALCFVAWNSLVFSFIFQLFLLHWVGTMSSTDITNVSRKKMKLTLDDKDQKTKERILRNRAAAQESRDRKRRYVTDLETSNKRLKEENDQLSQRNQYLEAQLQLMSAQLMALSKLPFGLDGFCDSARIAKRNTAATAASASASAASTAA